VNEAPECHRFHGFPCCCFEQLNAACAFVVLFLKLVSLSHWQTRVHGDDHWLEGTDLSATLAMTPVMCAVGGIRLPFVWNDHDL
jgi:hypothetical protein